MSNKISGITTSTIWFTGYSASGKSTLANSLHSKLKESGIASVVLDGDDLRSSISSDLGFSAADREENNRRAAEMAKMINNSEIIVIGAFITPTNKIRSVIKNIIGAEKFRLIFVDTPIDICEQRDIKSLYKRARAGKVKDFSGISSLFEPPEAVDIVIDGLQTVEKNTEVLIRELGLLR